MSQRVELAQADAEKLAEHWRNIACRRFGARDDEGSIAAFDMAIKFAPDDGLLVELRGSVLCIMQYATKPVRK